MTKTDHKFSTRSTAVDKLLLGGLPRGHILEISGPPGTPKEVVATNVVTSFVEAGEEVLFIGKCSLTISEMIFCLMFLLRLSEHDRPNVFK